MHHVVACLPLLIALPAIAAPPGDLRLLGPAAQAGVAVSAVAPDTEHALLEATVDADAGIRTKFPDSAITLSRSVGPDGSDALTLRWKDIWKSGALLHGAGFDLRPFVAGGTLAFDLKVDELARGGIVFKVGCGAGCERRVSHVVPGRAAQGQGWQRISLAMACFARDGDDVQSVARPFLLEGTGSGQVSVANVVFSRSGAPNTPCPDWRTVAVTPEPLNESWALAWWLPRHQAKLEEARRMVAEGRAPQLVLVGDSITQGWEKEGREVWRRHLARYDALGLGFGGDRTENVLWRLQHGAVDGLDPKVAVLMVGTNNAGLRADPPALTVAGIRRNIDELQRRLPRTRILVLAIFPRDADADAPLRRLNDQVNAQLPGLADGQRVVFLDINRAFLDSDGRLPKDVMPDLLHPNEHGYAIWMRAMQPTLERLMTLPPLTLEGR